jgi:PAS domain S-box-containing protein
LTLVEREASESSAQLRQIFDHSSEAIFLLDVRDPAHLRYESLNRKAEEATGFTSAMIRGKTPHEVFPASEADQILAHYRPGARTGPDHQLRRDAQPGRHHPNVAHDARAHPR